LDVKNTFNTIFFKKYNRNYSAKINKKVLDTVFVLKNQNPCDPLNWR